MNNTFGGTIKIFACNASKELAGSIANILGLPMGKSEVSRFSDGEISVRIDEPVRGSDVFLIQSTCAPVNENIMELLVMVDAMRRASAGRITAVIPYYGYARQDRKAKARDPISAKLVANIITTAGVDRILTMDLHCDQLQGFFNIPLDHLRGMNIYTDYFKEKLPDRSDVIIVSPDLGSVGRARAMAEKLSVPLAIVDKRRQKANESEVMNIIGDINGKIAILIDDMIDTAGSITNAAKAMKEHGAKEVYACCSHGVFSGPAISRLKDSVIEEVVILDTIYLPEEKSTPKIKVLSVADLFAKSIMSIHEGTSISVLFD